MPTRERRLRALERGTGAGFPVGRPRSQVPINAARIIRKAAAEGLTLQGIACHLGTNRKTLSRWMDEDEWLKEAMDAGRADMEHALHRVLYKAAIEGGNVIAAIYLTKARCGWREGDQSNAANRVSITFTMPAAKSIEQFTLENGHG